MRGGKKKNKSIHRRFRIVRRVAPASVSRRHFQYAQIDDNRAAGVRHLLRPKLTNLRHSEECVRGHIFIFLGCGVALPWALLQRGEITKNLAPREKLSIPIFFGKIYVLTKLYGKK